MRPPGAGRGFVLSFATLLGLASTASPSRLLAPGAESALPEGNAYVRAVLRDGLSQDAAINDYAYDLLETRERLDREGRAQSKETRAYEVYFVKTRPVRRLVARNGTPLSPRDQQAEDRRAEEQAKDIAAGRTVSERPGIRLSALLDRFDFKTVTREVREGRPTLIFSFAPRADARPSPGEDAADRVARILSGRLLIDEEERRVARLEAWNTPGQDARIATGVKVASLVTVMDFTRVAARVWLPRTVSTEGTARVFLFRTVRVRSTTTYSNYRRFAVETEERPQPFF